MNLREKKIEEIKVLFKKRNKIELDGDQLEFVKNLSYISLYHLKKDYEREGFFI